MDITEADKQFNYTIANVVAGVAEEIPVPGKRSYAYIWGLW
jgi:hypothetical protein